MEGLTPPGDPGIVASPPAHNVAEAAPAAPPLHLDDDVGPLHVPGKRGGELLLRKIPLASRASVLGHSLT